MDGGRDAEKRCVGRAGRSAARRTSTGLNWRVGWGRFCARKKSGVLALLAFVKATDKKRLVPVPRSQLKCEGFH